LISPSFASMRAMAASVSSRALTSPRASACTSAPAVAVEKSRIDFAMMVSRKIGSSSQQQGGVRQRSRRGNCI
jgi:hypothetical protein